MHDHIDCTGDGCSREFNLCRNRCTNDRQERSTEPPTVPFSKATTDSIMTIPVNACPTNTSCTPITITITTTVSPSNTASTIGQSSFNITSVIRSTITKIQEIPFTIVHTTTPTTWTTCPQNTIELMTTTTIRPELSESMPCTPIISTKFIATTVLSPLQSCTPEVSQFTTMPKLNITKFSTISLVLESCSCNKPGVPAQGTGLSVTISALGCLLGLSLVFLALVTAGWVWTCWTVRKRGGMTINSKQNK